MSVKIVHLDGLPPKGDVSDWLDAGHTTEELLEIASEASRRPTEDEGRVLLGRAIAEGIEPPRELVDDVLLEGRAHSVYSGPGLGKTFLMLWLALEVMRRRLPVIVYDAENGPRLMAERMMQQGADPALLDELLFYYPFPSLATTEAGRLAYEAALERVRPALVCFDSWIGFLAANGLDENSSNDIATFAANYIAPARSRGISTLMLDHVPHEGKHARGSTRKKDELDVVWSLRSLKPFDRETVGQVALQREKDREGWLPQTVGFSVGGDRDGNLVFARSAGTFGTAGDDGLKDTERASLRALIELEKSSAKASEWQEAAEEAGVRRRTFYNSRRSLVQKGYVLQDNHGRYSPSANECKSSAMHQIAPDQAVGANGAAGYKAAPFAPTVPQQDDLPLSDDLVPGESAGLSDLRERRAWREIDDEEGDAHG